MSGKLIVIGGAETQKEQLSIHSDILSQMFKENTIDTLTVVIPPSDNQNETKEKYKKVFKDIVDPPPDFLFLQEKTKTTKNDIDKIAKADLIFFAGGQQQKIMDVLSQDFVTLLLKRFSEENVCIAGTSAGAMIFSKKMIAEGSNEKSQVNEPLDLSTGIGLLPNYIIDTHFIERGRFARLAHAIKRYPECIGVGIEEDTALFFEKAETAKSYGCGTITVINGAHIKEYQEGAKRECIFNLKVHLMIGGCNLNLKEFSN